MLKIGHRGAKAYAPENTISSFRKALELGVDMIELDVRVTKDKYPVVVHDNKLHRLTKEFLRLDRLTLDQVKKRRVHEIETIPTLAEVLEVTDSVVDLNIELKVKASAQIVVQTLRDYKINFDKVMISSNYPGEIRRVKALAPNITTALIVRELRQPFTFWVVLDFLALLLLPLTKNYLVWVVRHAHADYVNLNHHFLDRKKVEILKREGVKICAWTVNNPKKIEYLKNLGIDGIITNYPDRL